MTAPPSVNADQVCVRSGGRLILEGVTLSLPAGSMSVLLGPNGSGKTTLIRVLAGIIHPASGTIQYGSVDLRSTSRAAVVRQCAYLPQNTETDFDIRVEDAVALGRYPHLGSWKAMQRADYEAVAWAMQRIGVMHLRDRPLPTLSGGERQRVFIARALAQGAPILLLDEPIAALDIGRQLELMALLQELNAEGRTVLCALHDLRPALDFFPRALLLDQGRLAAAGSTEEVIFGPAIESAFGVRVHRAEQLCFQRSSSR